jgi:hypothetical protein
MKTAQFSPNPASIVDVSTFISILKNVKNLQKEVRRRLIVTQNTDYFI